MRKRLSLILSLAVLIQSLAGINVYAADEVIIEAEDYVACDVTVNQMPGGTASTLSCTNQPMLEYDISIAEEGVYGIYVNGANISNVSFEVYLNDTQPISYVKPSTCSDWSIYSSFKISDVKLSVGTHRLKLKPMGAIALDYIGISESVIEEKNIISADLYDESTGTVENVVTNGVDVVKASGDSALKYNIKVRNADAYTLRLNTACATDNESLQIALDGEIIKTMNIKNTSSYELFADYMCVNMYLTEGEHTLELYIDAQEAVMLKYLTLNKTSKDESLSGKQAIRKSMIDWIPGGEGVAYHETTEGADDSTMISSYLPVDVTNMSGGLKLYATGGEWYKYSINVPETGMYDIKLCSYSTFAISGSVSIDDGKAHSISIPISEDWGVFTPHSQVKLKLEAGEHIVKFEFDSRGFHSDYFELTKVVEDFEVYAVFANDKALIGENKAIRGTEKIDIYFTDILNASTSVNVELSDGENVIPTECVIEDNVISVLLHSSLDYNSEYFINISGAKSESGISYTQNETVSFMTDGESNDSGVGVIAEASAKIDDNVMTAEGRIENGLGINMAGRGVWATLKNGSKTYTTDKVYTQEGGIFTLNYTMPSDAPDGDYTVKVFTEYNLAGKSFTLNYVSEATMNTIISDIQSTTTWEEVYNILKAIR